MAWFRRKGSEGAPDPARPPAVVQRELPDAGDALDPELPIRPITEVVPPEQQQRVATGVAAVEAEGVDIDDLASIGAGFDAALSGWMATPEATRTGHDQIVERYAMAIGEHLARHTDLEWQIVTDVFGTDLSVAGGFGGTFVVVPTTLVAARWMRREPGWIPGVVGHLVATRAR